MHYGRDCEAFIQFGKECNVKKLQNLVGTQRGTDGQGTTRHLKSRWLKNMRSWRKPGRWSRPSRWRMKGSRLAPMTNRCPQLLLPFWSWRKTALLAFDFCLVKQDIIKKQISLAKIAFPSLKISLLKKLFLFTHKFRVLISKTAIFPVRRWSNQNRDSDYGNFLLISKPYVCMKLFTLYAV